MIIKKIEKIVKKRLIIFEVKVEEIGKTRLKGLGKQD